MRTGDRRALLAVLAALTAVACSEMASRADTAKPPYPASDLIRSLEWHWDTLFQAAPGSDLWPVAWASDGNLYASWGDGGGFGGTNDDGRVSMGFARIEGSPEAPRGTNVNGGKDPEHPASFPDKGKTDSMVCVDGVLYAWVNAQDGEWPACSEYLAWSENLGATWEKSPWVFPPGDGNLKPRSFVSYGRDYSGVPEQLGGYVYFGAVSQGDESRIFLFRAPRSKLRSREAYECISGYAEDGSPVWSSDPARRRPVFEDSAGGSATIWYSPGLGRYLATSFHGGPGDLGVFEAPEPWGPWKTVAYYDSWGGMGHEGWGLTCSFPQKWMSDDGLTMWCVFAVYGAGARQGINAHDRFNLVKVSLTVAGG
jgi:hypothetical protein